MLSSAVPTEKCAFSFLAPGLLEKSNFLVFSPVFWGKDIYIHTTMFRINISLKNGMKKDMGHMIC